MAEVIDSLRIHSRTKGSAKGPWYVAFKPFKYISITGILVMLFLCLKSGMLCKSRRPTEISNWVNFRFFDSYLKIWSAFSENPHHSSYNITIAFSDSWVKMLYFCSSSLSILAFEITLKNKSVVKMLLIEWTVIDILIKRIINLQESKLFILFSDLFVFDLCLFDWRWKVRQNFLDDFLISGQEGD